MNFVKITSPVNQTVYANPVQLTFATQMMTMFGHSYNVGYSLDDSKVNSTGALSSSYTNEGTGASYAYETARSGSISSPILSEGFRIITFYAGYQYLGDINLRSERFEVYAYSTVEFVVGNPESSSPTPTQTPSPPIHHLIISSSCRFFAHLINFYFYTFSRLGFRDLYNISLNLRHAISVGTNIGDIYF